MLWYICRFLFSVLTQSFHFHSYQNTLLITSKTLYLKASLLYYMYTKKASHFMGASIWSGNMGNLPVVIIPAICDQKGGPFGTREDCRNRALSYSFFSLAVLHSLCTRVAYTISTCIPYHHVLLTAGWWNLHLDLHLPTD